MKKVGIVMGSDSDLPIVKKATDMLTALEIPFEVHVYSLALPGKMDSVRSLPPPAWRRILPVPLRLIRLCR